MGAGVDFVTLFESSILVKLEGTAVTLFELHLFESSTLVGLEGTAVTLVELRLLESSTLVGLEGGDFELHLF